MRPPGLVLDADAVTAYTHGEVQVGELISHHADRNEEVLVPLLCLAEAYRRATAATAMVLDILQSLANVTVVAPEQGDAPYLGGWTNLVGSMDLAHATLTASGGQVVPLLTSRRDAVTKVLSKEWPIIDL